MSTHVILLEGNHDDTLDFSEEFVITLQLIDQGGDKDHHTQNIMFNITEGKIDITKGKTGVLDVLYIWRSRENQSNGTKNKSHKKLNKLKKYLKNNELKFKVIKVKKKAN